MKTAVWMGPLVALVLCGAPACAADGPPLANPPIAPWGLSLTDQDHAVRPGDDFYHFQNGAWLSRAEVDARTPVAAYWRSVRAFPPRRLIAALKTLADDPSIAADSPEAKAGAFYRAFMDEKAVEARGMTPLAPQLAAIRAAKDHEQMAGLMGRAAGPETVRAFALLARPLGRAAFTLAIGQDPRHPDRYAVYLGQGGLLMPGPEFYLDPKLADLKTAYQAYVARTLAHAGWPDAAERAGEVVAFETRVAEVSWSHARIGDPLKTYNPMTLAQLRKAAPGFGWTRFFKGAGLARVKGVIVDAPDAVTRIADIYARTPLAVLQARQAFSLADNGADVLDSEMVRATFDFRMRTLNGLATTPGPREARAEALLETTLDQALGALYVRRYFSPEAKAEGLRMAANLRNVLDARLQSVSWADAGGRAKARDKLARMTIKLGYPDRFDRYAGLAITQDDLYGDFVRANAYRWAQKVARLDRPFDRTDWTTTPQSVNYFYDPATNSVEMPAATWTAPFFDLGADPAVNYGAIGTLLARSMAQAFDDTGIHYDADGRLRDWLSADEMRRYDAIFAKLKRQYSAVEPLPGLHINGELVGGEGLADVGGLAIIADAYHASLAGRPAPVRDGLSGDQRLYLGWAQMWRAKFSDAFTRTQLVTGANAPPFQRVNGPLPNTDGWYAAFDVKPGERMYLAPADRVRIW